MEHRFNIPRPDHIDCQILQELANRQDQAGEDGREEEYFVEVTGEDLEHILVHAMENVPGLIAASGDDKRLEQMQLLMGMGETLDYMPYYMVAWVGGLGEGLEKARGIEIPDNVANIKERFWDLDGLSVGYTAWHRSHQAATCDAIQEVDAKMRPVTLISGLWIDGYVIGRGFDAMKNPHIEGRSVLL